MPRLACQAPISGQLPGQLRLINILRLGFHMCQAPRKAQSIEGQKCGYLRIFPLCRFGGIDSLAHVQPPANLSALSRPELEALVVELCGKAAALNQTVVELREEIARLKGLKGRPTIKPSGMDKGTVPAGPASEEKRPVRGKITPRVKIEEEVIGIEVPPGSVFKGHEAFLVLDLVISATATCYLRERWVTSRRTDHSGTAAPGNRRPFWPGTASLRADAIPSGSIDDASTVGFLAIGGDCDLEAAVGSLIEREPRGLHRRGPECSARGAANVTLGQRRRHRCAPWREERVLHANRQ